MPIPLHGPSGPSLWTPLAWVFSRGLPPLLLGCSLLTAPLQAQAPAATPLVVGIDRDDRPYEYLDKDGQPAGYDVDLVRALAQVEGLDVTFRADTWENIRSRFASGEVDVLPGMLRSKEREAEVAFSAPHLVVHYAIFVRNDNTAIHGLEDLRGRRILVQQRSQMQEFLTARGLGAWLVPVVSEPEALKLLTVRSGDAAVVTKFQGMVIAKQRGLPLRPVTGTNITRQLCLAVHKQDQDLLARLDTALAILNQTGRYAEIYRTWFGQPDPDSETTRRFTRWALAALTIGLGIIALILLWTWTLKRRVDRATGQLREANRDIQEREIFLHTIIENLPVAIFGKDPRKGWSFTLWNQRSEQIFGLTKAEVLGKSDYDLFPAEQSDWFRQKDEEVIREGKAVDIPLETVTSKTLGTISLFTRKVPLFDDQGRPMLLLGIAENRTEQLAMEEALRQAQKLESLGVLAGGIAHDFNNLLTAILGNLGLARTQLEEGLPAEAFLENIEKTTLRAADLTRQMLAYSGRGVFVKVPLALDEAVREMVNLLQVSISKKVRLLFAFEDPLPAIQADAAQVQQVIMNLVTNASEAIGDADGEILLALAARELDAAQVALLHPATPVSPGRYVTLKVRDTGSGMSQDVLARIFDPFFTTKFSGRGLGMSAMLGILKAHEAGIRIQSELGAGTEFEICFPVCTRPAERQAREEAPPLAGGKVTLLVVDDEPDILEATTALLRQLDFVVVQARDGEEAIEVYRREQGRIQAVLMDLTMPRLDGLEAAAQILELDPAARLILTSGFSPSAQMNLEGLGLAGFLQKPFGRSALLGVLRSVLGQQG